MDGGAKRKRGECGEMESDVEDLSQELCSEDTESEYPPEEEERVAKELEDFVVDDEPSVEDIQALYDYVVTVGRNIPAVREYLMKKMEAARAAAAEQTSAL